MQPHSADRHRGVPHQMTAPLLGSIGRRGSYFQGGPLKNIKPEARFLDEGFYQRRAAHFYKYADNDGHSRWLTTMVPTGIYSSFVMGPWITVTLWTLLLNVLGSSIVESITFNVPATMHTVLGGALSFLVVFRTNVAYGRWWEARLTWGVVVNSSRALASQAAATMKTHAHLTQLITELLAFVVTLKSLLRCRPTVREELGTMLSHEQLNVLNEAACPPIAAVEALAHTLRTGVRTSDEGGLLAGCTYLHLSGSLNDLVNAVGACERLQTTPMPYGYVAALRCFLLLWLVTLPFTLISTFAWWSTPMVSIVAFLFFNLEQMAMEIEQPFGDDPNDLPLEEFCLRVERVLLDILRRALKPGSEGEEGGDKGRSGQPRQPDEALEARVFSSS